MGSEVVGDKQPSVRTLETGEKVIHYPDGRQVLEPHNSLADALDEQSENQEAASEALRQSLIDAATIKREALASGTPVPPDKRIV